MKTTNSNLRKVLLPTSTTTVLRNKKEAIAAMKKYAYLIDGKIPEDYLVVAKEIVVDDITVVNAVSAQFAKRKSMGKVEPKTGKQYYVAVQYLKWVMGKFTKHEDNLEAFLKKYCYSDPVHLLFTDKASCDQLSNNFHVGMEIDIISNIDIPTLYRFRASKMKINAINTVCVTSLPSLYPYVAWKYDVPQDNSLYSVVVEYEFIDRENSTQIALLPLLVNRYIAFQEIIDSALAQAC